MPLPFGATFDPAIFSDFFETDDLGRRALFNSLLPQGQSLNQQQQSNQLFTPVFNQFLGTLGRSLRKGQAPQSFADFAPGAVQKGFASLPQATSPGLTSRTNFGY